MVTKKTKAKEDELPPIDNGIPAIVEPAVGITKNQDEEFANWFTEMWDRIADTKIDLPSAIPTATIFLILLGAFDIYHYYSLFGINIIPFLEPIELVFSFATLLPTAFYTFVTLILLILIFKTLRGSLLSYFILLIVYLSVLFISMLLGLIFNVNAVDDYLGALLQTALMLPIFVIYGPGWRLKPILKASLVFIVVSVYLGGVGTWKGRQILVDRTHRYDVEVTFESSTVYTNDQLFYIGTTKGYIFFWDSGLGQSVMYPLSDAKAIHIRDKVKVKDLDDYINWVKEFPSQYLH